MSSVVFHKLSGSGNDFVMLDGRTTRHDLWPAERIGDRVPVPPRDNLRAWAAFEESWREAKAAWEPSL